MVAMIKPQSLLGLILLFTVVSCKLADNACKDSLWKTGKITNLMLKSSSHRTALKNSGLDCCNGTDSGGWCGDKRGNVNWVEVDFPQATGIRGVVIQTPEDISKGYVRSIQLEIQQKSLNSWIQIGKSIPTNFTGHGKLTISFQTGYMVNKLRIKVTGFEKEPCLRFDVIGCKSGDLCPDGCMNGGTCLYKDSCECTPGYTGDRCEVKVGGCNAPLGMRDGSIPNEMLSVSSYQTGKEKEKARYGCCEGEHVGAWCPNPNDKNPWYQVVLPRPRVIQTLSFQHPGRENNAVLPDTYMKNFKLEFVSALDPERNWRTFSGGIPAIYNNTVHYDISLKPSIVTDKIRIYPETSVKAPCFRFELLGCDPTVLCPVNWCHNGGKCVGDHLCQCTKGFSGDQCENSVTTMTNYIIHFKQMTQTTITTTSSLTFQIHGTVSLETENQKQVLHLTGSNSYTTISNSNFTSCLVNIDGCSSGFTVSLNANFLKILDNTFIISSGGNIPGTKGFALYYRQKKLYCSVTTSSKTWTLQIPFVLTTNVWKNFEFSWSKTLGLELYIDHVFKASVTQSVPTTATQTKQIAIGYGHQTQSVSIDMKIEGLKTYDLSRSQLVREGIVTKQPTTVKPTTTAPRPTTAPKTTITTTTTVNSTGFKILDFTFIKIVSKTLVTPSMNFTVFGNPLLIPDNHGNNVLVINKTGEYVELPDNGLECLIDISKCQKGFTLRADIKFLVQTVQSTRYYIFSSGGDQAGTTGIALYLDNNKLCSTARSRDKLWTTCKAYTFELTQWHTYQISWNPKDGYYVFVDGMLFMRPDLIIQLQLQTGIHPLLIGGSFSTNITTFMTIKNLYTWTASREILIQQGVIEEYTTPPPAVATTEYVKQTTCGKYPADIVFVIDESSSIGNRNFVTVKTFVKNLIKDLMTDSGKYVQIGLLTFASRSTNQFWLNQYSTANEIFQAIDRIKYGKRGTDIADGLKFARENSFSKAHGARDDASKILILFTDGYSSNTDSEAQKVHDAGITTMVIGVTKDVNEKQLSKIASKPSYLKHVDNFDGLDAIKEAFLKEIPCEEEIPKYEWNLVTSTISQTTIIGSKFNLTVQGGAQMNASHGIELTSSNQFIDFGIHQNLCVGNLSLCYHGITIQMTVMFMKLEENTVILTSGGDKTDGTGIALVYRYGRVQCVVSNSTVSWYATISRETLSLFHIHTILISWSNVHGLKIIVDNHVIQHTTSFVAHHEIKNKPEHMCIGSSISSSTQIDYFVKTVTIWHVWIGIIIDVGEIAPPIDDTTTTVATTNAVPATTEYCKMGWVCKDKMTTRAPTTTKKPTTTRKPTTRKPTTTQKPTTTRRPTTTTKPKPVKPTTPNKPHVTPGVDSHGSAYVQCKFVKAVQPNVEYIVYLNIDGVRVLTKKVSGKYESVQFTVSEINDNLNNKKITCSIQAHFVGQTILTTEMISSIFIPKIQLISHGKIVLIEGHRPKPIQVSMTGPPQMFCCKSCKGYCQVHIIAHANFDRHYTRCHNAYIPQVLVGWAGEQQSGKPDTCGTTVRPLSWNTTIEIPITANADMLYDRDHTGQFTVQAKIIDVPQPVKPGFVATPHTLEVGKIQVQAKNNDHKSTCGSLNDPHITTFDRKRYDNFIEGEFTLYRHKTLPFEVRAKYSKCSNGRPRHGHGHAHGHGSRATCNCAVAIKSGDDVITFTGCGSNAEYWQRHFHRHPPITVEMYKNGELTPGTLVRRIGCGQKYEVRLPTGTFITIQQSFLSFINIWIRPSSMDYGNTEGLCGMYDRNPNNDVIDGNGRPVPGRYPDKFSLMWRARLTLFGGVQASASTGITTFCSCVDTKKTYCLGSYGAMQCWDPRYDITQTLVKQAKVPQHGRHKRQAATTNNNAVVGTNEDNTTYAMNRSEAYDKCTKFITNNAAAKSCNKYLTALSNESTDNTERIENCALDLMITGDDEWTRDHVRDIVEECLSESERRPAPVNTTNNNTALPTENPLANDLENMCLEDCGTYGTCKQGVCDCNAGYSGEYCNISSSTKPSLATLPMDGMGCDMRVSDDCKQAVIFGDNFVQSEDLTCHYQYIQVGQDVRTIRQPGTVDAIYVSITQVICPLPDIKDTNGAYIRVSNDKTEQSDEAFIHLIYDSVCFDCEIENKTDSSHCARRPNTCIINGQCFAADSKKADNECKVCDPSNDNDRWTDSDATSCIAKPVQVTGNEETEKRNKTIIMILGIVCGALGFFLLFSLACICKLRSKYHTKEFGDYGVSKSPYESLHRTRYPQTVMDNPTYEEKM